MRIPTAYGLAAAATGLLFWIMHNDYVATGFACISVVVALLIAMFVGRSDYQRTHKEVPTMIGCLPRLIQWFSVILCFGLIASLGLAFIHVSRFELIRAFLDLYFAVILFRIIHWLGALEEYQNWPEMEPR